MPPTPSNAPRERLAAAQGSNPRSRVQEVDNSRVSPRASEGGAADGANIVRMPSVGVLLQDRGARNNAWPSMDALLLGDADTGGYLESVVDGSDHAAPREETRQLGVLRSPDISVLRHEDNGFRVNRRDVGCGSSTPGIPTDGQKSVHRTPRMTQVNQSPDVSLILKRPAPRRPTQRVGDIGMGLGEWGDRNSSGKRLRPDLPGRGSPVMPMGTGSVFEHSTCPQILRHPVPHLPMPQHYVQSHFPSQPGPLSAIDGGPSSHGNSVPIVASDRAQQQPPPPPLHTRVSRQLLPRDVCMLQQSGGHPHTYSPRSQAGSRSFIHSVYPPQLPSTPHQMVMRDPVVQQPSSAQPVQGMARSSPAGSGPHVRSYHPPQHLSAVHQLSPRDPPIPHISASPVACVQRPQVGPGGAAWSSDCRPGVGLQHSTFSERPGVIRREFPGIQHADMNFGNIGDGIDKSVTDHAWI